jgi:hypothetical protein
MEHLRKLLAVIVATLAIVCPAWAAPQWCAGTVSNLYVVSDATVLMIGSWRGDFTRVCNLDQPLNGISALTCASWTALLSKAVSRGSTVTVYYADAPACNLLPSYYNAPVPGYVMQNN